MNTNSHLISRDERRAFEAAWRTFLGAARTDDSAYFILQAVLRDRAPKKGFTAISNASKLANGQQPWQGYEQALNRLSSQPGAYLHAVWPALAGAGVGPTRYESLLRELKPILEQLKKEA